MKVLIIEDEKLAASRLARLLLKVHPTAEIIHTTDTVRDSIQYLKTNNGQLDLIFSDIHLADGTCFEIFDTLDLTVPIVFTTAFDEYTIKAFDFKSLHYLLKPIEEEDLIKALKKFQRIGNEKNDIKEILNRFGKEQTKRFLLKSGQKLIPKKQSELAYFYSQNKIVHTVDITDGKTYLTDFTLEQLENDLLSNQDFFRINRKHIVNKEAIKEIKPYKNQRLTLSLAIPTKEEFILSREKVNHFKEWFIEH
ncbi:MAG: response regulator transcription factor [Ekhidna sp.]|nr:response regulator transcription factor [Ekhidna sp.]